MPADPTSLDSSETTDAEAARARRAVRDNAKRVIRESGIGEMLQTLNRNALQDRGWFEEYDSGVLFKWGSGYTRRHIWIDINGDALRFRLCPTSPAPRPSPPAMASTTASLPPPGAFVGPSSASCIATTSIPSPKPQRISPPPRQRGSPFMPRLLAPEDLLAMRIPEEPQISPDGALLAYALTEIDAEEYAYRRSIWVVPTAGGEPRRFTSGPKDTTPRWSPDGKTLAFVRAPRDEVKPKTAEERARGVGKPQVWLLPANGGEARQLTFQRHGAGSPRWSPDGATLLFVAETGDPDDAEVDAAALAGKTLPRVRTITQLSYRFEGTASSTSCARTSSPFPPPAASRAN